MKKLLTYTAIGLTFAAQSALAEESVGSAVSSGMHQAKDAVVGESIKNLASSGSVTVSGHVTAIDTIDNEFTLKDDSGEIDVESKDDLTVSVGDSVTVSGTITEDMGEKEIAASKITVTETAAEKAHEG